MTDGIIGEDDAYKLTRDLVDKVLDRCDNRHLPRFRVRLVVINSLFHIGYLEKQGER